MKDKRYIDVDEGYIPPDTVAKAAEHGLFLKEKFNRGGTKVGWARARQLKERRLVTYSEIKRIASYFARHEVDKKAKNFGNEENPSKGYIAWLLWGGNEGKKWAEEIRSLKRNEKDQINSITTS